MATTIFATATITATPPPTTVLVASPCTNPAQIITATFTASKLPDGYPLHLFPPFTQHALPTVTTTANSTATRIPDKLLPFPNGAAPETPDPLGIHNVPWYYGPGPSVLLNLMAIVAILQLHLGPPSERLLDAASEPTTPPKGKLAAFFPRLRSLRGLARSTLPRIPLLYLAILTTLTGMNRAAWDLLVAYVQMERLLTRQDERWVTHAGAMGPPFIMLTWGLAAGVWRVALCLARIEPRTAYRSNLNPAQKQRERVRIAEHRRLLAVEGIGLVLPASSLGVLCFNAWVWIGGTTVESKMSAVIPADYMPALYWDGMDTSMHSILVAATAMTALSFVLGTAMAFFRLNERFFECCHEWVERHICRNPVWKVWLGYWCVIGVWLAFCVVILLAAFVGIGNEWLDSKESKLGALFVTFSLWIAAPWVVVVFPAIIAIFLLYLPFILLWYGLRGWVFRVINVQQSSFFIPYTETSVWEGKQMTMVALGLGLVFFSCQQIRQRIVRDRASVPEAPLRRR